MSSGFDAETYDNLQRILGKRVRFLLAHRYPLSSSYAKFVLAFDSIEWVQIDLAREQVAKKFEVFKLRARQCLAPAELDGWDRLDLGEFVVLRIDVLKQEEWIEPTVDIANVVVPGAERQTTVVDYGLVVTSTFGAEIIIEADCFPLLMCLFFKSKTPPGETSVRVPLT